MSLELILLSLARLWASFWAPWAPKGLSLASLWLSWDSVAPFGVPWAPEWTLGRLWVQDGPQFRANGSQVARLRTKSDLAELRAASAVQRRERRIRAKWRKSRSSQPYFSRAGG